MEFFFVTLAFLSLWVKRDPKIWGSLLTLGVIVGLIHGNILWIGLIFLAAEVWLWLFYSQKTSLPLFLLLIAATACFMLRLVPGYVATSITPHFRIGIVPSILGFLPLALLVPIAQTKGDWKKVGRGVSIGICGIGILAILATLAKATHWDFKLPSFFALRAWSNLILTCIPEEGFYRGFIQRTLVQYFPNTNLGKIGALVLTSLLFTAAHVFWSPNLSIQLFVFLAGLLYGGVYLLTGRIESAIFTHFLLNLIHMVFFHYHAM